MAASIATAEGNDADYDLQVLKNRYESVTDEIIITVFLGLFIVHFIPQPFVIVGIAVSTLGLM